MEVVPGHSHLAIWSKSVRGPSRKYCSQVSSGVILLLGVDGISVSHVAQVPMICREGLRCDRQRKQDFDYRLFESLDPATPMQPAVRMECLVPEQSLSVRSGSDISDIGRVRGLHEWHSLAGGQA